MEYSNCIDTIAALGKFGIDNSLRTRDDKEWAKSGIDCLSAILKQMQSFSQQGQNLTIMGMEIEKIPQIKEFAHQYSVEKVVLFPCPINNQIIPYLHVYGGDSKSFFAAMGLECSSSSPYITPNDNANMSSLESKYGVILYESE